MQSGLKRRAYTVGKGQSVTGIATDALNRVLVASTLNGTIYVRTYLIYTVVTGSLILFFCQFFDFHTTARLDVLELPSTAASIELQRDSGLLGIICDDHAVRIVDIETRKVVRELKGFQGRVLDVVSSLFYLPQAHV